jgi:hypothetical protein
MVAIGAEGGTRTPTLLLAVDFESTASTNSATPARMLKQAFNYSVSQARFCLKEALARALKGSRHQAVVTGCVQHFRRVELARSNLFFRFKPGLDDVPYGLVFTGQRGIARSL